MTIDLEERTYEKIIEDKELAIEGRAFQAFGEIVDHLGENTDYPEGSIEKELYERYTTERMTRLGTLPDEKGVIEKKTKYIVPGMTEPPRDTVGMMKMWLGDFYRANGIKPPKGFHRKNRNQLLGLYHGTLGTYGIKEKDIVQR
jgi:hypothetical protein|tara:strand:- start:867 stop:1298 length:432 start_codon:yes stop_codon:yes gene_type:complete